MSKEIVIKGDNFYQKIERITKILNNEQLYANVDALVVNLGLVKDDDTQPKTCLFHLWLLAFEFSETIIGVSKESLVVLTSKRKQEILEKMEVPQGYKGPALKIILRDPNSKEQAKALVNYEDFYKAIVPDKGG